jgi:hypothetical protein
VTTGGRKNGKKNQNAAVIEKRDSFDRIASKSQKIDI